MQNLLCSGDVNKRNGSRVLRTEREHGLADGRDCQTSWEMENNSKNFLSLPPSVRASVCLFARVPPIRYESFLARFPSGPLTASAPPSSTTALRRRHHRPSEWRWRRDEQSKASSACVPLEGTWERIAVDETNEKATLFLSLS